ncbi:hypothetical protein [Planktothrix pseudagardhii]|uniref:Uncharacterized protein n=1 Tax=Planktothrix pseudagardhii TaxID=132604 RepID=A0A9W4CP41_9CYAN|nr:hypothetical protein [Planktothrix pseudagardhii]CAD5967307.1 hypothetical protein NO713_03588 [Planktothrix pseudagardhii]
MIYPEIEITESDFFICKAFEQILKTPRTELNAKLGDKGYLAIANYLTQIPVDDYLYGSKMASHITAFCQQTGNEVLYEWLGKIYDQLDIDGINNILKKTGDPGGEADQPIDNLDGLENDSRDICLFIQDWAKETPKPDNPENQNGSDSK